MTATVMRAAHCLLDSEAGSNPTRSSVVTIFCAYRIKRDGPPTLRTATKQPSHLDGLTLLNLLIGNLDTRVWPEIVPQHSVDILLRTAFIDRFIRDIFLSERKAVP